MHGAIKVGDELEMPSCQQLERIMTPCLQLERIMTPLQQLKLAMPLVPAARTNHDQTLSVLEPIIAETRVHATASRCRSLKHHVQDLGIPSPLLSKARALQHRNPTSSQCSRPEGESRNLYFIAHVNVVFILKPHYPDQKLNDFGEYGTPLPISTTDSHRSSASSCGQSPGV